MIELENVSMKYKGNSYKSLDQVSFKIDKGDIVGLIGPNGAGKTTLVKIICGLIKPTSYKKVMVNSKSMVYDNRKNDVHIGLILNSNQLYDDLSALENIMFYTKLYKIKKSVNEIEKIMAEVGLQGKENMLVSSYSTGMKQKLNIAKVLIAEFPLLILDEPTSGMDPVSKMEIYQLLLSIKQRYQITIIIATHAMNEVEKLCNKVIVVNSGKVIYSGKLRTLKELYCNNIYDLYVNDDIYKEYLEEIEEKGYKYYSMKEKDHNRIVVLDEQFKIIRKNYIEQYTLRKLELEDIFIYLVTNKDRNDD